MKFIAEHADRTEGGLRWGVEPICRVLSEHGLPIAPSTYYDIHTTAALPGRRQLRDEQLKAEIRRVHAENYRVYGARKVWLALNREGITVARCAVERLMGELGLVGARRGRRHRTTIADAVDTDAERTARQCLDLASAPLPGRFRTGHGATVGGVSLHV